jgi:L-fuconolactonase
MNVFLQVIDTHLHFWDLATYGNEEWLKSTPVIHRSFLPSDVKTHFDACGVDLGVIVEAGRLHRLNLWWLDVAARYDFLGAVVAGGALEQDDLTAWLDAYRESPYFVGVRTSPAGPPESWEDNSATDGGLRELARRDLSLDLLLGHEAFPAVARLAARHPSLRIILDHCAHPPIREGQLDRWRDLLAPLAVYDNIWVKYSSLLLYPWPESSIDRLRPIAALLMEHFGISRLAWGSNWPVELLGGSYEQAFQAMCAAAEPLTQDERAALLGGNAASFYRVRHKKA